MIAVELETVRNVALVATVAVVVLAVVLALTIKAILGKLVAIAILVGVGFVLWSSRADVTKCVAEVQEAIGTGGPPATCTFLGVEIDVPLTG